MRTVDDCALVPLLKTGGAFDGSKSARNRFVVNVDVCRMNRGDCDGGLRFWVLTGQGNWPTVLRFGHTLQSRFPLGCSTRDAVCGSQLLRSIYQRRVPRN